MKKIVVFILCVVTMAAAAGCAKKSATEQLRDDMHKAGNEMDKETKALFK